MPQHREPEADAEADTASDEREQRRVEEGLSEKDDVVVGEEARGFLDQGRNQNTLLLTRKK
jgi:hypothetical protein